MNSQIFTPPGSNLQSNIDETVVGAGVEIKSNEDSLFEQFKDAQNVMVKGGQELDQYMAMSKAFDSQPRQNQELQQLNDRIVNSMHKKANSSLGGGPSGPTAYRIIDRPTKFKIPSQRVRASSRY